MESAEEEETSLSNQDLDAMTSAIWSSFDRLVPERRLFPGKEARNRAYRFAAAACFIAALSELPFLTKNESPGTGIAFSSDGTAHEVKGSARHIDFYLKPGSYVEGDVCHSLSPGNLHFSGTFKIVNTAETDLEIDFRVKGTAAIPPKKVTIENHQTYYVGVLKQVHSPGEILVLNARELEDIPPRIKIMAFNDHSI